MGFLKTTWKVCTGTEVFLLLVRRSIWRAILHLLLLGILLALLTGWGQSCTKRHEIRNVTENVFRETGGFVFGKNGIRTKKNPDQKLNLLLAGNLRLDYRPGKTLSKEEFRDWTTPYGALLMDKGILLRAEIQEEHAEKKVVMIPYLLDKKDADEMRIHTGISPEKMLEFAEEKMILKEGKTFDCVLGEVSLTDPEAVISQLNLGFFLSLTLAAFLKQTGLFLFSFLLLSAMHLLWRNMPGRRLGFRELLIVEIYAAFPALTILMLVSLALPQETLFSSLFFVIYAIYDHVILRKLIPLLNQPENMPPDENN